LSDFRHAELARIIRELEAELSEDQPDWDLVLIKADDLISLALLAINSTTICEKEKRGNLKDK